MTDKHQAAIQIIGSLITLLTLFADLVSPKYKPIVVTSTTLIQAIAGYRGMYSNPDGTSARAPWTPDKAKAAGSGQ